MLARTGERGVRGIRWLLVAGWLGLIAALLLDGDGPWLRLWWLGVVPALLLAFLVLGHDTWRRVCPLSALNQVPRRLGLGRSVLVGQRAWIARHALALQFLLLALAVVLRLTLLNHDARATALFLLAVLALALLVGLLAGGKTWCHQFCPLAPVQLVCGGPGALLATPAAAGGSGPGLSQSMCRVAGADGDRPTCVGCTEHCPDIDLERSYWERLGLRERRWVAYAYLGLVAGYVAHLRLGLPAPWAAASIGGGVLATVASLALLERGLGERGRHRLLTAVTVLAVALLAGLGVLPGLPAAARPAVAAVFAAGAALWGWRTWSRSRLRWRREAMAESLRRRLAALPVDLTPRLGGTALSALGADEVLALVAALPPLEPDQRRQLWRGVLADAAACGRVDPGDPVLAGLRLQLGIGEEEGAALAAGLEAEAGSAPRLASYRQALERLVLEALAGGGTLAAALESREEALRQLRAAYRIDDAEQERVLAALGSGDCLIGRAGAALLEDLNAHSRRLAVLTGDDPARAFLRDHGLAAGRALAAELAGVRTALAGTAAGTALDAAVRAAPIDRALVPEAAGGAPGGDPVPVLRALAADPDPVVAAVARHALAPDPPSAGRALRVAVDGRPALHPPRDRLRIGRDPGGDVVLDHPLVSRQHVLLVRDGAGVLLTDLDSGNGTLVDGRLVRGGTVRLAAGADVRLGGGPRLAVGIVPVPPVDRVAAFLALRDSPLGELPREALWSLAEHAVPRAWPAASVLIAAGDPVRDLLLLTAGAAEARAGGRVVGTVQAGETLGEIGLLAGTPASATVVVADGGAAGLIMPGVRFAALIARHPGVAAALLGQVGRRLAGTLAALHADPGTTPC